MFTANFPTIDNSESMFSKISLKNISYVQAANDPTWSFFTHSHSDSIELSYIFSGSSALYIGDKYYETKPGDLIIKNANTMHAEKTDVKRPIEQVCLGISGIKIDDLEENHLIDDNKCPIINVGAKKPFFDEIFRYITDQTVDTMYVDVEKLNNILTAILELIYKDFHLATSKDIEVPKGKDITPVFNYIQKNFNEDISIEKLAKKFFISPFYLSKKFKAQTGFTINQYLLSCRMGEAQRLLIFSDKAIKDIALECGYDNLSYFYTTFKKFTASTPQQYKEKYRH